MRDIAAHFDFLILRMPFLDYKMHSRPRWKSVSGIGAWNDVIKLLAIGAVLVCVVLVQT